MKDLEPRAKQCLDLIKAAGKAGITREEIRVALGHSLRMGTVGVWLATLKQKGLASSFRAAGDRRVRWIASAAETDRGFPRVASIWQYAEAA